MQPSPQFFGIIQVAALTSAVVVAALSFLLPMADVVQNPFMTHLRTAIAALIFVYFMWAAVIFSLGVRAFRATTKVSYSLLVAGIILFSISFLQLPIIGSLNLWDSLWATSGGVIAPFVLSTLFMYLGIRRFARQLKIDSPWASYWFATAWVSAFTLLSFAAAYFWIQYELPGADAYIATVGWCLSYAFIGGLLARKIASAIGEHYRQAIRSLSTALFVLTIGAVHEYVTTFFLNNGHPYEDYGFYMWPFIICGIFFIQASIHFLGLSLLSRQNALPVSIGEAGKNDYIDSIIAAANLASRPDDTDPFLDDLRVVTSGMSPGENISAQQKQSLLDIYHRLEAYLKQHDSIRKYSQVEIWNSATPAFRRLLEKGA